MYLHDGDQVVAEYVQEAGGPGWELDRRHHWAHWIDQLAAEEVDTDGDGEIDKTLFPITDLLGSVQLLTDENGEIVERITVPRRHIKGRREGLSVLLHADATRALCA